MPSDSDGIDTGTDLDAGGKRKPPKRSQELHKENDDAGGKRKPPKRSQDLHQENDDFYKPFYKLNYKRVFPESIGMAEYTVFVESRKEEIKLGNTNPLMLAGVFKNEIKGVINIRRINASKVGVVFSRAINANDFLKNENFLEKYDYKAFIPARAVETIGVLRYVPISISNEDLFKKLSSKYEVVAVRRFTKKVNGQIKPFSSSQPIMSPTRAAGLVIFRHSNKMVQFLLLQTSYGEHHWTPPKGHVDPGESDWETALRETKEEAGLSVNDLEIYKDVSKTMHYEVKGKPKAVVYWLAKLKNPDQKVTLSDEHQDMKWLPLQEAQKISGYEEMQKLLEEFHEKALKVVVKL